MSCTGDYVKSLKGKSVVDLPPSKFYESAVLLAVSMFMGLIIIVLAVVIWR